MSDEKRLSKKRAKICYAVLIAGLVLLWIGAQFIPDTTESLFQLKICAIIIGCVMAWGSVFICHIFFKCPHCGESYIAPQWNKERFCPVCGEKVRWE